ncbi:MAG TPA: hypothetical protein VF592_03675 [Sphingomonas sp.]|uniref:hypothetical protein n=1 Tax=Sphingomonas sp. TaxID=28214 RepID=UPI002EDAA150
MADIAWPDDLVPYRVAFHLQPHVGGQESPVTRTRKTYGLSAPRWLARLTFRGGYGGEVRRGEQGGYGARLDSLIADLHGGLNIAVFHDWRRPKPVGPVDRATALRSAGAPKGATSMIVTGFAPGGRALGIGDYIGGDGRPHLVSMAATLAAGGAFAGAGTILADATGAALVGFNPPLSADIPANTVLTWPVTGRFELMNEDAGQNETEVGSLSEYALDFVEKLGAA